MNFEKVEFESSFGVFSQLPESTVPEIAFSGRSNVGKSSLLNKLVNRKSLARVSASPGKTATINFFKLDEIRLADLPGYGYAKVARAEKERWAELMEGYFSSDRNIKLVVQLVDMRRTPTADDFQMMEFMVSRGYEFVIVMTKSDKLNKSERQERLSKIQEELRPICKKEIKTVVFSALSGEGTEELRSVIEEAVSGKDA